MQFLGSEAERQFRLHFHRQRVPQDRVFACTQVAIVALLLLRDTGPLPPALRLLYWGTCAASAAVLALSFFARHRYATLRPHLLVTTRVVYNLLCPQLVWHLASQNMARNAERGSWPSFFLLWVTWTRWGSELLTQVGFLLPFNVEALLTPFGALLDMLNNRRLCRLLTTGEATESQRFYHAAFARLASRLTVPFEMLFAAASDSNCTASGGKDCGWSICTVAASGAASADGSPALSPAPEDVAACHCESVFSLTQLVLSVLLPLLLLGCAEASQRRQFAACQLSVAAQREEAEGSRTARRRRRRSGSTAWCISFDSMRLLALLALIQFRVFLSLRFGVWQSYSFAAGGTAPAAPPAPLHSEL